MFKSVFKEVDNEEDEDTKRAVLEEALAKITCLELVRADDPVVRRLAIYVLAHRNYLQTLPYEQIRDYKVNWGLRKTEKLSDQSVKQQSSN